MHRKKIKFNQNGQGAGGVVYGQFNHGNFFFLLLQFKFFLRGLVLFNNGKKHLTLF